MEKSTILSMALGIPAVVIAVIALAMAFNAGGDDVDDGTVESVRSLVASESAQNTRIEWLTTQVGDLHAEVAAARQQEAADAAKLTADVEELRSLASRDDRYDDAELRSAVRDNQTNLAELNRFVDNDAGRNESIIGIAASLEDMHDAISDSDESTKAINTELGALRAQLTELQGAVSSGGSSELDDALSRLDWLEKAVAPAYTQAYVEEAVRRYNSQGRQATLEYYSDMASVNGDLYLFVLDADYKLIVHPTIPANIGMDIRGPLGTDITGKNYSSEFVTVDEQGKWVDYVYLNPANDFNYERKHSWIVRHENLIFGSGWYEREVSFEDDPSTHARALVDRAIARYSAEGSDAAIDYYNTPESVDGHVDDQWYVFIVDTDDLFLSHAPSPSLLGTDLKDVVGSDGFELGKELAKATETGRWVEYLWLNPATDTAETKRSWVIRHDGLIFGSGYYGE